MRILDMAWQQGDAFANSVDDIQHPVVRRTPPFSGPAGAIAGNDTTQWQT
ncbi:hypothetical protein SNOG_06529 [Parastagonospora nodorum SN15]|uniref:Uncharacterized protein n=1 Tax=Phaeosphaeria nodorum (strain SN15 / ATCC MYA-4574 / FGSC 10173) TaxID=321614 RepID=Q0UNY5_PHANO|nr:hypothetical protein SNOG_06529 [Parastagonospora nodorum SN15]EAT86360.1 hypothetical protein SNOG_06529 [Parastagonospora nodorum SN15]